MRNYLLCVEKRIQKIVGVSAKNTDESRQKILKMIKDGRLDFNNCSNDEITFEISEFYSPSLERKLKKILGEKAKKRNEEFKKLTQEFIDKDEKEHIEICCKKCGDYTPIEEIIHQLES